MFGLNRWRKAIEIAEGPLRRSHNPYDQDDTENVWTARIKGPWHSGMIDFLKKHGVGGLSFSYRDGFRCDDYSQPEADIGSAVHLAAKRDETALCCQ